MSLTIKESIVVQSLRAHRAATMKTLREELAVSHMTVARAVHKYGYYTSVNCNAKYYTLYDVPRFDEDGLWNFREICFSKHGTLEKTLVALIQNAVAGLTVAEMEQRVNTKVGNLLSRLCHEEQLTRCFTGHRAVYLCTDSRRQQQQRERRDILRQESRDAVRSADSKRREFPPGHDVLHVLEVLIQIIRTPQADAATVARAVRARGISMTAVDVQQVIDFYALKKKRHSHRRSSAGTDSATDG